MLLYKKSHSLSLQVMNVSDCCNTSSNKTSFAKKRICPSCSNTGGTVSPKTIQHHINQPWDWDEKPMGYYFCKTQTCETVYFGEDDSVISQSQVRTKIGLKQTTDDAIICYCYGVTKRHTKENTSAKTFVTEQTKAHHCACSERNPSGRCCLKDF